MNPENPKFNLEEAENEASQIRSILEKRNVQSPDAYDYESAEKDLERTKEQIEAGESVEIEKIVDAILFDWDGVLYDGMHNIGLTALEVCNEFGKEVDMEYFMENYSQPWWRFYQKVGIPIETEEEKQKIYNLYHQIADTSGRASDIYPEISKTLRELTEKGLQLGIMSAGKLERIKSILDKKGLLDLFDEKHIVGFAHEKADAIRQFYTQNNLSPDKVLMVGDLPSDLEDGRSAGVKVAAMARFESATKRLGAYNPDFLLVDLGDEILRPKPFSEHSED